MSGMKRMLAVLLAVILLVGVAPLGGLASLELPAWHLPKLPSLASLFTVKASAVDPTSGSCGRNATWRYDTSAKTLTISGSGWMNDASGWAGFVSKIETVIIEEGITLISESAFSGCSSMTSVAIPASVAWFSQFAFEKCSSLKRVNYNGTVASWCGITFAYGCNPGTNAGGIYINQKLLTNIKASDLAGVEEIKSYAFAGFTSLKSIEIPKGLKKTGIYVFDGCTGLAKVNCTGTLADWCAIDFSYFSGNPTQYAKNLYIKGTLLTEITASSLGTATKIGDCAFMYCDALKKVTLSNHIKSLGTHAFAYCAALDSVSYSDSLETIGNGTVWSTPYIKKQSNWENGALYIGHHLILVSSAIPSSYTVRNGTITIADGVFNSRPEVTRVRLADSVRFIGGSAFKNCANLTSVTLGERVVSIGNEAFLNCEKLESTYFPNSVAAIGADVFKGSAIKDIYYGGTQRDKSSIAIEGANEELNNATWHYGSPSPTAPRTVTYNANGGTVSPASVTVEPETSTKLPTPTKSFKITYNANGGSGAPSAQTAAVTCRGWATASGASDADYSCGASYKPPSDVTLYAVWAPNTKATLSRTAPTRTGYAFLGWGTSSSSSTVAYSAGDAITLTGNQTLYAVWKKTYTVTYNANGGMVSPASVTEITGNRTTLPTPTRSFTITYHANGGNGTLPAQTVNVACSGWAKTASAATAAYACGDSYTVTANVTLYAVWKVSAATTLRSVTPSRAGYVFLGWSTDAAATRADAQPGAAYTVKGDVTLYAVWKVNEHPPTVAIRNYTSTRSVDYKTTLTFSASVENAPENAQLHWFLNGAEQSVGDAYTVKEATADYTVQVKLIDANGTVHAESSVETVKVNTGFFAKLVAFFKGLFGSLPVIVQTIRETL
ncbi:MAG: leucine-rich repeat protein [Clostridia bacterium]|nr:leucine-rich repeat protein [Clostridia bacterium]